MCPGSNYVHTHWVGGNISNPTSLVAAPPLSTECYIFIYFESGFYIFFSPFLPLFLVVSVVPFDRMVVGGRRVGVFLSWRCCLIVFLSFFKVGPFHFGNYTCGFLIIGMNSGVG